jgi:hypothetical protein
MFMNSASGSKTSRAEIFKHSMGARNRLLDSTHLLSREIYTAKPTSKAISNNLAAMLISYSKVFYDMGYILNTGALSMAAVETFLSVKSREIV